MIECRPIVKAEAPAYLRLLCRVFELDYIRAEQIFFHEPFFDLARKWALFEDGRIRSVLTTVPLNFGFGDAIGIAGVATGIEHRGRGLGQTLVEATVEGSAERYALLFAREEGLYARCGFERLDDVIRAPFRSVPIELDAPLLGYEEVRMMYDEWALQDPARLQRNEVRWTYWKWNLRMCAATADGYVCQEGDTVRESIFKKLPESWPVFEAAEWFGLRSMAQQLGLPLEEPTSELILMGRGLPCMPQLFMTDQF